MPATLMKDIIWISEKYCKKSVDCFALRWEGARIKVSFGLQKEPYTYII